MLLTSSNTRRTQRELVSICTQSIRVYPINFPCISTLVLRINLILKRIRILDPHWKKMDPDPIHEKKYDLLIFSQKNFRIIFLTFSLIFFPANFANHSEIRTFLIISLFSIIQIWVLVDILFLDTDPNPKHCFFQSPTLRLHLRVQQKYEKFYKFKKVYS